MRYNVINVDVTPYIGQPKNEPHAIIERKKTEKIGSALPDSTNTYDGKWYVVSDVIPREGQAVPYSMVRHEGHVRVPLFQYKLASNKNSAVAAGIQLGCAVQSSLLDEYAAEEFYIFLGESDKCESDVVWLGLAIKTKS